MYSRLLTLLILIALGLAPATAPASGFDREPNDTPDRATSLVHTHRGVPGLLADRRLGPAVVARGRLEPGDVDFFRFGLRAGQVLTVSIEEPDGGAFADPLVGIFGPGQSEPSVVNDDGGPGFLSRVAVVADRTGTWRIAVTGFGDDDFDGTGHDQSLRYRVVVAAVRDPAWHTESERGGANDTAHGAPGLFRGWRALLPRRAAVISGRLEPGDTDSFRLWLHRGSELSASVFDLEGGRFNDSLVRIESRAADTLAENDDGGPGFLSNLVFRPKARGFREYRVVLTGFDPDADDGRPHPEAFDYQLVIAVDRPLDRP